MRVTTISGRLPRRQIAVFLAAATTGSSATHRRHRRAFLGGFLAALRTGNPNPGNNVDSGSLFVALGGARLLAAILRASAGGARPGTEPTSRHPPRSARGRYNTLGGGWPGPRR